jgi:CSLREA domain-containing protein
MSPLCRPLYALLTLLTPLAFLAAPPTVYAQTTLAVTTFGDEFGENDGACSLREAVQVANTESAFGGCGWSGLPVAIHLPAGTYALSRAGAGEDANATGDLDVLADVILEGAGDGETVLDGMAQDRLVQIAEGVTVEVGGLTLTNGRTLDGNEVVRDADPGGGIHNAGELVLRSCTISENVTGRGHARADDLGNGGHGGDGGGVYNAASGTLSLYECSVSGNVTGDGGSPFFGEGGDGGDGGGIYNAGRITLGRSTLSENTPGRGGRGMDLPGGGGRGGGLFSNGAAVHVEESWIADNRTNDDSSLGRRSSGGGVAVLSGSVRIVRSTLSRNETRGYGGGLYMVGDTLRVANSTFSGNRAYYHGAGLALFASTRATLDNVTIVENDMNGDSSGPSGSPRGGGVYAGPSTTVRVRNSILAENRDLYSFPGPGYSDCGGALISEGHNLVGNGIGCGADARATDQSGTWTPDDDDRLDPLLLPLADNGGSTHTHLPLENSPALDVGSCTDIAGEPVAVDQRRIERPAGETCDVGAVERETPSTAADPGALEGSLRLRVYPNPMRSSATVELSLKEGADVRVAVYDALGREVATLHEGTLHARETSWRLDGQALPSGLYLVHVTGEQLSVSRRLVVLR